MHSRIFVTLIAIWLIACTQSETQTNTSNLSSSSSLDSINGEIVKSPNDKDLYLLRAKILYEDSSDFESALSDLERVIGLDSNDARPLYYQALWSFSENKIQAANDAAFLALEKDPEYIKPYLLLSNIYFLVQNYEESILMADEVLKRDLYNAEAYYLKALNFKEAGDTSKAVSSFLTATEQKPDYYEAWMELGLLFGSVNNENTAFYYDNAIRIRPASNEALYNQALYFQVNSKIERAMANYQKMLANDSNDLRPHYNLGYIQLVHKEDFDSAIVYFNNALEIEPNNADALYNKGLSYELKGELDSALVIYKEALKTVPNHDLAARAMQRILG